MNKAFIASPAALSLPRAARLTSADSVQLWRYGRRCGPLPLDAAQLGGQTFTAAMLAPDSASITRTGQASMRAWDWLEAWIDGGGSGYVLIVGRREGGAIEIVDPQEGGRLLEAFDTYADATAWLNEDEYDLLEGRWRRRP